MGYSLGDDKKSFDIFEETNQILDKLGSKFITNDWLYNEKEYLFCKNHRSINLDANRDQVDSIYISDDSIDYDKFCFKNKEFVKVYDSNDNVCCICISVTKDTDVDKLFRSIKFAPLKQKDNNYDL